MHQFKPLQWHANKYSKGAHATPDGLKLVYHVVKHNHRKIEFSILNDEFEPTSNSVEFYTSVAEAKQKAQQHYLSLLQNLTA